MKQTLKEFFCREMSVKLGCLHLSLLNDFKEEVQSNFE